MHCNVSENKDNNRINGPTSGERRRTYIDATNTRLMIDMQEMGCMKRT